MAAEGTHTFGSSALGKNGVGDFYGFKMVEGVCQSGVVFWDHEEGGALKETDFKDVFEYLVAKGLRSQGAIRIP
jgi:hypothetical protein